MNLRLPTTAYVHLNITPLKNTCRRLFLRDTSLAVTGLFVAGQLAATEENQNVEIKSCAPTKSSRMLSGTIQSVRSGNWSDPATWGTHVPEISDTPLISGGHVVVYDLPDSIISGVNVNSGGTLQFDAAKNTILRSTRNVVIEGKLIMQPASHAIFQTLEFIEVIEDHYIGGAGMDVLDSDTGLWVMGSGKLDLQGSNKIAWLNAAGNLHMGDTVLTTKQQPHGWQIGDEIAITPTGLGDNTFERRKIIAISGNSITIDSSLALDKLKIDDTWTAEIMNLKRNVNVQGTKKGAAHVAIMSSVPQSIRQVEFKYLGPRKDVSRDNIKEFIRGRYALHFHHCADGSRGSIVDSCCVHDVNSHSYVFHSSHGITFKKCVAFNVTEIPYWSDPGHPVHDTLLDECIAAKVNVVFDSLDMNQEFEPNDSKSPNVHSSGFKLGVGDGNACINCVAVGTHGDTEGSGGFDWEANNEGIWKFADCLAHNNQTGLFVWQATNLMHIIQNFHAYSNHGAAIYHGSYANVYRYFDGKIYNSNLIVKANSIDKRRLRFENIEINANGRFPYAVVAQGAQVSSGVPVLIRNVTMKGWTKNPVYLESDFREDGLSNGAPLLKHLDLVHCDMGDVDPFIAPGTHTGEVIRVQPKPGHGACYQLSPGADGKAKKEIIPRFAPDVWGTGNGLAAEYFYGNDFTNPAFQRIDPYLDFGDWYDAGTDKMNVDYRISQNKAFSVKWSGFIEAQFSEQYELYVEATGNFVLTLDGVRYTNTKKIKVMLVAGQKYSIELRWSNSELNMKAYSFSGVSLRWNCDSLEKFIKGGEPVPMSQLYAGNVIMPPAARPQPNTGPAVEAGTDIAITLPVNSVQLTGSATDSDGTIKSYSWTKLTGPSSYKINDADQSTTKVTSLEAGIYVFRLSVTDNNDAVASDDVQVIVNAAPEAKTVPTANAGTDQVITLPVSSVVLTGTGSDPAGNALSYKWSQVSGPTVNLINDTQPSASVANLKPGTYVFNFTVTDSKGSTASDEVQVLVNAPSVSQENTERDSEDDTEVDKISKSDGTLKVRVHPNPTTSHFTITIHSRSRENIIVSVYNRWGKLIDQIPHVAVGSTLTIGANYRRGTYYFHVAQGEKTKIVPLLKI